MANFKQGFWYMSEKDIYIGKNTITQKYIKSQDFKKGQPYLCPKDNYLINSYGQLVKVSAFNSYNGQRMLHPLNEKDTIKLYRKYFNQPNAKMWMYKLYAIYIRVIKTQHLHEEVKNLLNNETNFNIYNN